MRGQSHLIVTSQGTCLCQITQLLISGWCSQPRIKRDDRLYFACEELWGSQTACESRELALSKALTGHMWVSQTLLSSCWPVICLAVLGQTALMAELNTVWRCSLYSFQYVLSDMPSHITSTANMYGRRMFTYVWWNWAQWPRPLVVLKFYFKNSLRKRIIENFTAEHF